MIKIISDSTCDLSRELIEKYNIQIIPLHVHLGEEEHLDGVTITPDEIYTWADANNTTPKTSAASMTEFIDVFQPIIDNGDEIICFSISSSLSANFNVMRLAVDEMEAEDKIRIIDSANLSTGIGLLVIEAALLAQEGKSLDEIVAKVEEYKPRVSTSFVVNTLTYLHRGGRCSGVAALAGGVLKLHPKIVLEGGKMDASKKYRGKMDAVILSYAKDMEEDFKNAKKDRVFITHSGCDDTILNRVKDYLEGLNLFDEILITRAGSVISSHCGYGTVGVLFIRGE